MNTKSNEEWIRKVHAYIIEEEKKQTQNYEINSKLYIDNRNIIR